MNRRRLWFWMIEDSEKTPAERNSCAALASNSGTKIHSATMKRILPILMLLVLSLQSSWIAAATYCSHEKGAASSHFGHHDHQHRSSTDDPSGERSSGFNGSHVDCGVCHLSGCKFIQFGFLLPEPEVRLSVFEISPRLSPSFIPERPERPSWHVLA